MAKTTSVLEQKLNANFGWVLVLLLVAGTSFLLGSSINRKASQQQPTGETPNQTQSVIGDISNALQNPLPTNPPAGAVPSASNNSASAATNISGIVNINTASAGELDTLPGIGPAYAQAIINYRLTNGPFVRIEDIEKVRGIGPKTFEKLKSRITI